MNIIERHLNEIKPYGNNTKRHDAIQIDNVAKSIKRYGFVQPIVIDRNGTIIIGHCRYEAAKILGLETVPVVLADTLTPDQVDALRIIDNKTNESDWDIDKLRNELDSVGAEADFFAFDFDFGDDLKDGDKDEPNEPDAPAEPEEFAHSCPRCGYHWND